jgi:hypothetical protein
MTLEPAQNKYIRFFDNIRAIQSHVISKAEEHMFPRIDNTNVDRSVSLMHSVIMKALRKVCTRTLFALVCATALRLLTSHSLFPQVTAGKVLFDPLSQKCPILHQIYRKRVVDTWSSRQMLETIRNKKSKEAAISKRDVRVAEVMCDC